MQTLELDMRGEISLEKREEILQDLVRHIQFQGGYIFSTELAYFYAKHPGYQGLIRNVTMRKFILQQPGRLSLTMLEFPLYRIDLLDAAEVTRAARSSVH